MSSDESIGWQAQTLRLTLFTRGLVSEWGTIWHDLTERDPDVDENRVRESTRRQVGSFGNGELATVVNPVRTDVLITPVTQNVALPNSYIGPAESEIDVFASLTRPWLERQSQNAAIIRIAFGGVLLLPVKDREAAYANLSRLLPNVNVDGKHTRELFYRVNRPKIGPNGLELNRITAWNSLVIRKMAVTGTLTMPVLLEEHFVCLDLDNSSPVDQAEPLAREVVVPIYDFLVEMALENAERGENP